MKCKFIGVKPQCNFSQFCAKYFYCIINRIILNIYRGDISKEYERQDVTGVDNIIDIDQKAKGPRIDHWGTPIFRKRQDESVVFGGSKMMTPTPLIVSEPLATTTIYCVGHYSITYQDEIFILHLNCSPF